jgi:hypothetical protein
MEEQKLNETQKNRVKEYGLDSTGLRGGSITGS